MTEVLFKPSNILTFETVQADSRRLHKLLSQQRSVSSIHFNLADVVHCDSTGLALLIETKRFCNKSKIPFVLENISETLSGLATFCGVDMVLV